MVVCLYAVYHLIRRASSRPAASSASYHFFALIADVAFIPFYVYTLLLSRRNADMEAGTIGRWRTMFPTDDETNKILLTTWLTALTAAAIHLVSLFIDMYLVLVFRNISSLPPDMNPLEDNLTSRKKSKHKHKNSSISAMTDEKRFSAGSTIGGQRYSQSDPLLPDDLPSPTKSQVAFMHTRTNTSTTYSPHTPRSAHESKDKFAVYSQPATAGQSHASLQHRNDLYRRDDDVDNETLAQRKSFLAEQANIKRNPRNDSYVTSSSKQDFYTPPSTARSDAHDQYDATGDLSLQHSRDSLHNDNWFVQPDDNNDAERDARFLAPQKQQPRASKGYHAVSTFDDRSDNDYAAQPQPQPLGMNPPTPQPTPPIPSNDRTLSMTNDSAFSYAYSRSGASKVRSYGNLKPVRTSPPPSPPKKSAARLANQYQKVLPGATTQYVSKVPGGKALGSAPPLSLDKKSYTSVRRTGEAGYTPVKGVSPRVVSRSGVDYVNPYEFEDSDAEVPTKGTGRRRDVSGKVAEEGRGRKTGFVY
jgi:hypothetical protein